MRYLKEWRELFRGKKSDFAIICMITTIFLIVIIMNDRLIFRITSNQTEEIGQMQLEVIRSDFQGTLQTAEGTTMRLAMEAEQMMKSGATLEQLRAFFIKRHREQKNLTGGVCFNVYVAGRNWVIFPEWTAPPDYHASERAWYKGAIENNGKIYITEPYIDAMTGGMCYTMSKMLADGETVVSIDFNFADVQYLIRKMTELGNRQSLIVTKSGMIIGYTDMDLVGKKVSEKLPEYEGILSRVTQTNKHDSFTAQIDGSEHTIFSSETSNGWYMILSVDNWAFYKDSYIQILVTTLLSLVMMVAIIFFYLNARSNGLRAENALRVKEEFLSRLSHELRDPLHNILDLSSTKTVNSDANPAECAAKVRESALKLSDMLENLFSFSTMVTNEKKKVAVASEFQDKDLSKVSRYSRIGIMAVLISAMAFAFIICFTTTMSWGDTKMNRELDNYDHQLSTWVERQKSILSMFVNVVSANPKILNNYDAAVKFLDDMAKNYPDISVCYIGNPYNDDHPMTMNNGWVPEPSFHVEERPWYTDAEKSADGFSISAPYLDAQTGVYCVTLSQMVYGKNGGFLGVFAIDFYLDQLVKVLGDSYTKESYAFLVDKEGIIINHPNNDYQQSEHNVTNIEDTEYAKAYESDGVVTFNDYTGNFMACLARKSKVSNFTVVVANSWLNIYGTILLLGIFFILLIGVSVLIVRTLINRLLSWQESVNGRLKAASDTAMAASKAKSQFLAQMSHEIRTPINAVLGMNEMILRESKTAAILEYAANIQSAGRTLLTLINSILDFSKIEDGKMEIVPVRYETMHLIDDLVNMTLERAKKKGLELKTEIDSRIPRSLYGDDVRLRQVITNILTNAVKYTHKGSVTLSIAAEDADADTLKLRVKVTDTGIGIHPEDIDKLFLSFQRLDEEKNRNIEGTGLGISIVQKLLDMMGSKLEVESEYGKGSTFSFTIKQKIIDKTPLGDYDEHHTKIHEKITEKKFLTADGAKILAVDDNDMNLKVISGLLKRNKIFPDLAESGQQGIELAKKNFYDIIFLDNMMPVMNGIETFHKMRQEKILDDKTKVIMLTASAIAGMRETYLREGFDDYLSKPIDVSELEKMLAKYLPADMIKYEDEESTKIVEVETKPEVVEEEPQTDSDTFSDAEKKKFAEQCPDINLETGLRYCMDSKSFLIQMLTTFTDGKKADKIQEKFEAGDWKNYQILVHALKSTSLSVGAENLSEQAKSLEMAAKNNSIEEIQANHADLMANYAKVRDEIAKWLGAGA
ncbi:MAG: response regulator [Selenomonadaceae bacterium]|nr:response regulator [Selenomonadaceae bacterium]